MTLLRKLDRMNRFLSDDDEEAALPGLLDPVIQFLLSLPVGHARTNLSWAPSFDSCSLLKRSWALCHASTNCFLEAPSIDGRARRISRTNCETQGLGRSNTDPGGPP